MMHNNKIDKLIINSPFEEPTRYWDYNRTSRTFSLKEGRRPAGYRIASEDAETFDDPGRFIPLPLVNQIRTCVKSWREGGYQGVTGITKRLLEYWHDPNERETHRRFFFCNLDAIETLIWQTEAPDADKVGIEIPSDGGAFQRLCTKLATATGKTVVMAMLIAWHILNKVTYPKDTRFSKYFFVVAPGLTVKSRLQVLIPENSGNYYEEFSIVPTGLLDKLRQGKILIQNWHALQWDTEDQIAKKRSVDKRGVKSDRAYVREVLGTMSKARNIMIINDEAHHAWRMPSNTKIKGIKKQELEEATKWIGGLDRIHRVCGILCCYDFSATPFVPSVKKSSEETLFGWIISDFGLNDAIESGLVKTPRVVVRDDVVPDAKTYKSKLYHIYKYVKDDLNQKAQEHIPLPDLVINAYYLLGLDWRETKKLWEMDGALTPPVMITVTNRVETAARIKYSFDHKKILIDELCSPEKTIHIDSKVLEEAESHEIIFNLNDSTDEEIKEENYAHKFTKTEFGEYLRKIVDTIGRKGQPGEQIQNIISVGMLSEGWDAKTVTHIMGLRAFTSQLLCEQVVGRGLRRTSYEVNSETGLYDPEYVNIFGIPFTFLPHETHDGPPPPPQTYKTLIEPVPEKAQYEINWPNIIRIEHIYRPKLELDMSKVKLLSLDANKTATLAELAPIIDGKPDVTNISEINLKDLFEKFRTQRIIFETARDIYDQLKPNWEGTKEILLAQLIKLVEKFLSSKKIKIMPPSFNKDEFKRRILITLNINRVVQHIWEAIHFENAESIVPIFDKDKPIFSTRDMRQWYTSKPYYYTKHSHINFCVFDSAWEASEASELDRNPLVEAWVKNDHLGFQILYIYQGVVRKYWPDFIIRLTNGSYLVLETKGIDTQKDKTKRRFLDEWVKAVNEYGNFGKWQWAVSKNPADVKGIIEKAAEKIY